ncbi:hypothetical protein H2248_003368, partial [Termitomyces sp. 'cryptogamus']
MITGYSMATLVIFMISITSVIFLVYIPLRASIQTPANLTTAPIFAIGVLWAARCLGPSTMRTPIDDVILYSFILQIRDGIVDTDGVKPYNILVLFFSFAYMAVTLVSSKLQRSGLVIKEAFTDTS